jgi:ectoine hydroxylase-related dioxygenase (phytanoyl-CoA dioxygenase family)
MKTAIFTPDFNRTDTQEIADQLRNKMGYTIFEDAITPETLSRILDIIQVNEYLVNNNWVGFVRSQRTNFLSHTLAISKECYDMVTSEKIIAICQHFFNGPYKLSNQRIYQTHTKAHMPWHTDNNLQSGNTFKGKHTLPGIMFLLYLTDVAATNPFQFVPESHKWSMQHSERYFTDKYIEQNYADKIVSVRAPKGTLVICNTHLIHRAEPFDLPGFKRLTFLFQVDQLSEAHAGHGEKLLIDPSFVEDTNPAILNYLGFGIKTDYPTFPQTSVATMLPRDLLLLYLTTFPKAVRSIATAFAKSLIPESLLVKIKNRNHAKVSAK